MFLFCTDVVYVSCKFYFLVENKIKERGIFFFFCVIRYNIVYGDLDVLEVYFI